MGEERGRRVVQKQQEIGKAGVEKKRYVQESKLKITMDLRFERNLDVEIEVEAQSQGVALPRALALLVLHSVSGYIAQRSRRAADEPSSRVLHVVECEVVEWAASSSAAPLLLALASPPPRRLVLLRLLALGLSGSLCFNGPGRLLLVGAAAWWCHCGGVDCVSDECWLDEEMVCETVKNGMLCVCSLEDYLGKVFPFLQVTTGVKRRTVMRMSRTTSGESVPRQSIKVHISSRRGSQNRIQKGSVPR